jgi:hypothetical protein
MALIYLDGFDDYTTASQRWASGSVSFGTSFSRFGVGQGIRCAAGGQVTRNLGANYSTLVMGVALNPVGNITTTNNFFIRFIDTGTNQIVISQTATSGIAISRNATLLSQTGPVLSQSSWIYLEFKITFHSSAGSYELRLNGAPALSQSGINTQNTANAYANQLMLNSGSDSYYDDLYMLDTTGSANNDFLGDVRIYTLMPSGNGTYSQWTGSDGNTVDNYLLVDDPANHDTDTTYVETNTVNNVDTYALQDVPSTATVYGVQLNMVSRKTDAGTRGISPVLRSGGADYVGTERIQSSSYQWFGQLYDQNPSGPANWTATSVNALEAGVKVTT